MKQRQAIGSRPCCYLITRLPGAVKSTLSRHFVQTHVHVSTCLAACIDHTPKGLYKKAKAGQLSHLNGWDDPYECGSNAELVVTTTNTLLNASIDTLIEHVTALQKEALWIPA
ncbi:adenylyl-sulfate kinase [Actimicrobium sp. CCI2.3]|uniref:adenylyl-sulfate kinase n=1 Tax=Actimicrobium sp. CCI2.3 TaxID=3048616 RepID=UPI002AB367BE|nr:adenylyl-sulfate kinase [Actimicrobium sp. CCI2.3]MDY7574506.1 adenylyl-sulfate kinase [Actimicrobium sp. CCI2.3]MEB0024110.1 adenylyl-sulfate kinase [Actimicrobium sp. CCI2.3]